MLVKEIGRSTLPSPSYVRVVPRAMDDASMCTWKIIIQFGNININVVTNLSLIWSNTSWHSMVQTYSVSFYDSLFMLKGPSTTFIAMKSMHYWPCYLCILMIYMLFLVLSECLSDLIIPIIYMTIGNLSTMILDRFFKATSSPPIAYHKNNSLVPLVTNMNL